MYSKLIDYSSFLEKKEHWVDTKKIINLIIYYPESSYEQKMKNILSQYLITVPGLTFYFITLREQADDIIIDETEHILYVKGKETFIPGILDKTIRAISYCHQHMEYDYIIRSNISTVIDYSLLEPKQLSLHYMGCHMQKVQWTNEKDGIDLSLWGVKYAQGIMIFLTKKAVELLVEHKHEVNMSVIDDVSLGQFFTKRLASGNLGTTVYNETRPALCHRNHTASREDDVERMKVIVDQLLTS